MMPGAVQGVGLGLRPQHFSEILSGDFEVPWFEVLLDNFLDDSGLHLARLSAVCERYPVVAHSVGLNLGGTDPLDESYLNRYTRAVERIKPLWVSDHCCWTAFGGRRHHDLLPLPFTQAVAAHVADRIKRVQDRVGLPFLLENVSSYVAVKNAEMPEWAFLMAVAEAADCGLLLDVNNVYVNARNHGFSTDTFLAGIDPLRVCQIHLAGHTDAGDLLIDSHGEPISEPVWSLYAAAVRRFGAVPACVERDANIPQFEELTREMRHAGTIAREASIK